MTGGSGFIGSALVARLTREGWAVRALARSDGSAAAVERAGARAVRGDLSDVGAMSEGAAGCEVAFHLAAKVGDAGPWKDFQSATVQGTANALAACRAAGVRRFVHAGSEAALMEGQPLVGRRRDVAAEAGLPRLLSALQGAGGAGCAGGERGTLRDRGGAPSLRLGTR